MTEISSPTTTRRRVYGRGHWSWLKGRLSVAIRYEYKQNTLQQGVTIGAQINAIAMATCKSATISFEVMAAATFLSRLKVAYSWGHSGSHYKAVIFKKKIKIDSMVFIGASFIWSQSYAMIWRCICLDRYYRAWYGCKFFLAATIGYDADKVMVRCNYRLCLLRIIFFLNLIAEWEWFDSFSAIHVENNMITEWE